MKPKHLLLCVIPLAFAACEGPTYSFRAGPTFADVRGNLSLADSAGQMPAANSMDGGLGLPFCLPLVGTGWGAPPLSSSGYCSSACSM